MNPMSTPDRENQQQPLGVGIDEEQHRGGQQRQCRYTVTEYAAFRPKGEHMRQPVVLGQQLHQDR